MPTKRPQDNVTKLSQPPAKVHFSLLVDDEQPAEPFMAELTETFTATLTDPTDLTIEQLSQLREPLAFLRLTAPDDETRTELRKLTAKKFGKVMRAYFAHFGIEDEPGKSNGLGF
jgi:hypothetical protein